MRKFPLIAAALAGFFLALLALLPARLIASWLPPSVTVGTLNGSIWNGSTDSLAVNGRPLGALRWHVRPLHLFIGRLSLDGELSSAETNARGRVAVGLGGKVSIQDLELDSPLSALPFNASPQRWNGELHASLHKLSFDRSAIHDILGTIEVRNLRAPPPDSAATGSYRLSFDESSKQDGRLIGKLQDLEGPMQVGGTLVLGGNRDYVLEGLVAPRPGASDAIMNTLQFLGAPDAQGRRPFSVTGTY